MYACMLVRMGGRCCGDVPATEAANKLAVSLHGYTEDSAVYGRTSARNSGWKMKREERGTRKGIRLRGGGHPQTPFLGQPNEAISLGQSSCSHQPPEHSAEISLPERGAWCAQNLGAAGKAPAITCISPPPPTGFASFDA